MQDVIEKLCVQKNGRRTKFERNLIGLSGFLMWETLKGIGDWTSVGRMKLQCGIQANITDLYAKKVTPFFPADVFPVSILRRGTRESQHTVSGNPPVGPSASTVNYYTISGEISNPI
jgi:hypothetical protein